MANVPEQQSINASDYPKDDQQTVGRMAGVLNDFMSQSNNALNANLTFGQNFRGYTTQLIFNQNNKTLTYRYQGAGTPSHLFLTNFSAEPQTAISPYWVSDGKGNITLTIKGDLNDSRDTRITILAISE